MLQTCEEICGSVWNQGAGTDTRRMSEKRLALLILGGLVFIALCLIAAGAYLTDYPF